MKVKPAYVSFFEKGEKCLVIKTLSPKSWKCIEIHTESFEQLESLYRDIIRLMRQLKEDKHLTSYFFNRYAIGPKNEFSIKLGLVNSDKEAKFQLNSLLKKHGAHEKPYDCDMREVDGIPIDEIKCISCELLEKIMNRFKFGVTTNQIPYLFHFLTNQLGFGYEAELDFYKGVEEIIEKRLKEIKAQIGK